MGYDAIAVAICGAIFYARAAAAEKKSPWIWTSLPAWVSGLLIPAFHRGWLGVLLRQVVLLAGITVFRTITEKQDGP